MLTKINKYNVTRVIILIIALVLAPISYAEDIEVSARVSVINNKPEVISVTPNFTPVVLAQSTIQTFSIQVKDIEGNSLTYTVTPQFGAATPISGTISDSTKLQNSEAFINFTYLSTNEISELGASKITLTLNDGNAIFIQEIDIYTF